jgi:RNA polymerase sigma factor (sigma-70 family)
MYPGGGPPFGGAITDAASEYRRLLAALSARAKRLGSRDPESASQETFKRSLENQQSRCAMQYYFSEAPTAPAPEWALEHLFAWLHAVLYNVIREERSRAGYRREVESGWEPADPSQNALDLLLRQELEKILSDCFRQLEHQHRAVLRMRAEGLKYGEIANRLGVSENTVATWVSRGTRALGRMIRRRHVIK